MSTYYKPQSPLILGSDYVYPLTTEDQVILEDGSRLSVSDLKNLINTAQSTANGKAPTSHASAATTYGTGTSDYFGHVKLSDSVSSTSGADSGIAASPAAVKKAYDLANAVKDVTPSNLTISGYTGDGYTVSISANKSKAITSIGLVLINIQCYVQITGTISSGTTMIAATLGDKLPSIPIPVSIWVNATNSRRWVGGVQKNGEIHLKSNDGVTGNHYIYISAAYFV